MYWMGPLEVKHGRIPGYWQRLSMHIFGPVNGAPSKIYGDEKVGKDRVIEFSEENLIDFEPKYFSHRILTFLTARGACYDGALCWSQLPPELLTYQACIECKDQGKYPHESKFFALLQRKWPRHFVTTWAALEAGRPPLSLLTKSASDYQL